jgi:hypothetical protein
MKRAISSISPSEYWANKYAITAYCRSTTTTTAGRVNADSAVVSLTRNPCAARQTISTATATRPSISTG